MPDVLMSPDRVPAKFSMVEPDPPCEAAVPRLRRMLRITRKAMLRLRPPRPPPVRGGRPTSAAAW